MDHLTQKGGMRLPLSPEGESPRRIFFMDEGTWVDRKDDELRHSDQAWMNDKSWMDREPINRIRSPKYPQYRKGGYFESGLPGLMARHPLMTAFVVMALGGLCFLIFSLVYL